MLLKYFLQNPHPRKNEVREIALNCDLKEETVFNNHRSSNKIKTEIKAEMQYPGSEEPSNRYQVNPKADEFISLTYPQLKDMVDNLPRISDLYSEENDDILPGLPVVPEKFLLRMENFNEDLSVDLHKFETVDLGSLANKSK